MEEIKVDVPMSWPWSAPELTRTQHGLTFQAAKATDVYSVGLVCLWLMFGEKQDDRSQESWSKYYGMIARLKQSNGLIAYVQSRLDDLEDVDEDMKSNLLKFCRWTTTSTPNERIPRLTTFMDHVPAPAVYQKFHNIPLISVSTSRRDWQGIPTNSYRFRNLLAI